MRQQQYVKKKTMEVRLGTAWSLELEPKQQASYGGLWQNQQYMQVGIVPNMQKKNIRNSTVFIKLIAILLNFTTE